MISAMSVRVAAWTVLKSWRSPCLKDLHLPAQEIADKGRDDLPDQGNDKNGKRIVETVGHVERLKQERGGMLDFPAIVVACQSAAPSAGDV